MSKKLKDLNPYVAYLGDKLIKECEKEGITVLIYQTLRTKKTQDYYYSQGRTRPGTIITNAKGGHSYHNYGLAFDCVPMINGKAMWNRIDLFNRIGEIGERIGLTWGGHFKSITDRPHFQWSGELKIKDLLKGKKPVAPVDTDLLAAIHKLKDKGVINSPEYWIESNTYKIEYVQQLVINFTKQKTFNDGIKHLARNKIINSPDYWIENKTYSMNNVKALIKKLGYCI